MLPDRKPQQKVVVQCLIEHNGKILLVRGSKMLDAVNNDMGYFGMPRFTVKFGQDPVLTLVQNIRDIFGALVKTSRLQDLTQRMADKGTQEFEVSYYVELKQDPENLGDYTMFVSEDELERYVFPSEAEKIKKLRKDEEQ